MMMIVFVFVFVFFKKNKKKKKKLVLEPPCTINPFDIKLTNFYFILFYILPCYN